MAWLRGREFHVFVAQTRFSTTARHWASSITHCPPPPSALPRDLHFARSCCLTSWRADGRCLLPVAQVAWQFTPPACESAISTAGHQATKPYTIAATPLCAREAQASRKISAQRSMLGAENMCISRDFGSKQPASSVAVRRVVDVIDTPETAPSN